MSFAVLMRTAVLMSLRTSIVYTVELIQADLTYTHYIECPVLHGAHVMGHCLRMASLVSSGLLIWAAIWPASINAAALSLGAKWCMLPRYCLKPLYNLQFHPSRSIRLVVVYINVFIRYDVAIMDPADACRYRQAAF